MEGRTTNSNGAYRDSNTTSSRYSTPLYLCIALSPNPKTRQVPVLDHVAVDIVCPLSWWHPVAVNPSSESVYIEMSELDA